jgi:CheY-like chemotaxis protein
MYRVLLADDVPDNVDSLRILLQLWGHEVRVALDGAEAVEVAAAFKPHVALLDIRMPRMHGAEAARRIRELLPEVRIFALSATDRNDPLLAGYDGVFDDYLSKPYNLDHLEKLLAGVSHDDLCRANRGRPRL